MTVPYLRAFSLPLSYTSPTSRHFQTRHIHGKTSPGFTSLNAANYPTISSSWLTCWNPPKIAPSISIFRQNQLTEFRYNNDKQQSESENNNTGRSAYKFIKQKANTSRQIRIFTKCYRDLSDD